MVAGVFFASCPFLSAHLNGHFNLTSAWVLPLYAAALIAALRGRGLVTPIAAGAVLVLSAYTDYYYTVFLIVLTACAVMHESFDLEWRRSAGALPLGAVDVVLVVLAALLTAIVVWILATGGGVYRIAGVTVSMKGSFNLQQVFWLLVIALLWRRWRPVPRVRPAAALERNRAVVVTAIVAGVLVLGSAPILALATSRGRAETTRRSRTSGGARRRA